ncbi:hypothetical protein [Aurantimonas marina]|uniref:hypothetical protein n=1 Tax=Aurantimonas marina TaxID=2780508 RepID=UPI0019D09E45|nr:hypothetical protein [Aurantimonas marina]
MGNYVEGARLSQDEDLSPEDRKAYRGGLERFHKGLEKLHTAEAELARLRADLAHSGTDLTAPDSLHW